MAPASASIHAATSSYEAWASTYVPLDDDALAVKHREMARDAFALFRATFYRWVERWAEHGSHLAGETPVLAVGDLHVENFGTWRDAEGRLVWGVNDFDEAWKLPWPFDLVRLAASARLATDGGGLALDPADAAKAICDGYRAGLERGGRPFVLAERHAALHAAATARLHEPRQYWEKLAALPMARRLSEGAAKALRRAVPPDAEPRYLVRAAGLGALGRPRVLALYQWHGGLAAREAKALVPSAGAWAAGRPPSTRDVRAGEAIASAVRCPDPFLDARRRWLTRRLAPDCSRIELGALPHARDERRLLRAMGAETANVHLGSASGKTLLRELRDAARRHGRRWLDETAASLTHAVRDDWRAWASRDGVITRT